MFSDKIYLLDTKLKTENNEKLYKVGRTKQQRTYRLRSYPTTFDMVLQRECSNSFNIERSILLLFNKKYSKKMGNEYFAGDKKTMICDINKIIDDEKPDDKKPDDKKPDDKKPDIVTPNETPAERKARLNRERQKKHYDENAPAIIEAKRLKRIAKREQARAQPPATTPTPPPDDEKIDDEKIDEPIIDVEKPDEPIIHHHSTIVTGKVKIIDNKIVSRTSIHSDDNMAIQPNEPVELSEMKETASISQIPAENTIKMPNLEQCIAFKTPRKTTETKELIIISSKINEKNEKEYYITNEKGIIIREIENTNHMDWILHNDHWGDEWGNIEIIEILENTVYDLNDEIFYESIDSYINIDYNLNKVYDTNRKEHNEYKEFYTENKHIDEYKNLSIMGKVVYLFEADQLVENLNGKFRRTRWNRDYFLEMFVERPNHIPCKDEYSSNGNYKGYGEEDENDNTHNFIYHSTTDYYFDEVGIIEDSPKTGYNDCNIIIGDYNMF
jgi:hypothetical protein